MIWFFRDWLVMMLAAMLVWTFLPLLAPVAMAAGWTGLGNLIYTFYLPFCHQLPQRSWFFFGDALTYTVAEITNVYSDTRPLQLRFFYGSPQMGWRVAWSDRCISFYTMTPVFGIVYRWLRRWSVVRGPISIWLLVLTLLPLVLDGGSHLINDAIYGISNGGFRDNNGWLAYMTNNAWPNFYAGDHLGTFNWWMRLFTGLLAAWGLAFWLFPWVDNWMSEELAWHQHHKQLAKSGSEAKREAS